MSDDRFDGIAGLEGRLSVGCALTVGVKPTAGTGYPSERDRFHLVWPQEDEAGRRPLHPQFGEYNRARPEARRAIYGVLAHARQEECFSHALRCQGVKGRPMPPSRRPFCSGDGRAALRYVGVDGAGVERFDRIACPHDACEFRQGEPAPCKPHMRFLFMLAWGPGVEFPAMLCKFTSGAWNTTREFVGFFGAIRSIAVAFGLDSSAINLAGFRFVMQLTERSNKARKSRYPVVTITPVDDIAGFLQDQSRRAMEISGRRPVAALTDREQRDPTVDVTDWRAHEVTPDLDTALATAGLTMADLDTYLADAGKPPVATATPEQRAAMAAWLGHAANAAKVRPENPA